MSVADVRVRTGVQMQWLQVGVGDVNWCARTAQLDGQRALQSEKREGEGEAAKLEARPSERLTEQVLGSTGVVDDPFAEPDGAIQPGYVGAGTSWASTRVHTRKRRDLWRSAARGLAPAAAPRTHAA